MICKQHSDSCVCKLLNSRNLEFLPAQFSVYRSGTQVKLSSYLIARYLQIFSSSNTDSFLSSHLTVSLILCGSTQTDINILRPTQCRHSTATCLSFSEASLWAQLAECRAQVEHWQGVATICELSKQEELAELQKQCDQEIQSLQEALRGQYMCLCVFFCLCVL